VPRRRFTDEEILAELTACAARLGRSPTMRELAADPGARLHPQTVVERFGSWNRAKRAARLAPRRFATRDELLVQLRALGDSLGRTPTGRDLDERRGAMPSKSLYWHSFGSLSNALRAAGYDVPTRAERAERALEQGERLARRLGRLPRLSDWARASARSRTMLSEWQVYRLFGEGQGGWRAFHSALRGRLSQRGTTVDAKGFLEIRSASPAASVRTPTP
jgi:Homing endonuclease associated repeat